MKDKILASIQKTIQTEIEELQALYNRIDEQFVQAVLLLYECKGKVIVTGIGKSANIANKFVATLNSTGTNAQFLHASEAIHGDLGMVNDQDVVICISNSGNSPEIKSLAPLLKQYAHALIAITGNTESSLANYADCILNSMVDAEADPNNLAPTASTTVQIAICDGLAIALMELKEFSPKDFAMRHPGGTLGKRLTTYVEDLVDTKYRPSVDIEDPLKEVIVSLSSSPYGITVVMNQGEIAGVITDGDLRRSLLNDDASMDIKAKAVMTANPKNIQKGELAIMALEILQQYDIGQLLVLDGDHYYGIIEIHRILDLGIV